MTNGKLPNPVFPFAFIAICVGALCTMSCASNESKVKKLLEESLKRHGVREVVVDLFHTDPAFPAKAYTSATVTYNFATAEGKPQREFLGFVLGREGDGWRIEQNVSYTKDPKQASIYLAGGKSADK